MLPSNRNIKIKEAFKSNANKDFLNVLCNNMISNESLNITVEFEDEKVVVLQKVVDKIQYTEGISVDFNALQKRFNNSEDKRVFSIKFSEFSKKSNYSITSSANELAKFYVADESFQNAFSQAEVLHEKSDGALTDFYGMSDFENFSILFLGSVSKRCQIESKVKDALNEEFSIHPSKIETIFHNTIAKVDQSKCELELSLLLFNKLNNELKFVGTGSTLVVKSQMLSNMYSLGKTASKVYSIFLSRNDKVVLFSNGIGRQVIAGTGKKIGRRGVQEIIDRLHEVNLNNFLEVLDGLRENNYDQIEDQTMLMLTV